jgi:hypothetical protein
VHTRWLTVLAFSIIVAKNSTIRVEQPVEGDETSQSAGVPDVLGDFGSPSIERSREQYSPHVPRSDTSGRASDVDLQHFEESPEAIRKVQTSRTTIQYKHYGEVDATTIAELIRAGVVSTPQRLHRGPLHAANRLRWNSSSGSVVSQACLAGCIFTLQVVAPWLLAAAGVDVLG